MLDNYVRALKYSPCGVGGPIEAPLFDRIQVDVKLLFKATLLQQLLFYTLFRTQCLIASINTLILASKRHMAELVQFSKAQNQSTPINTAT